MYLDNVMNLTSAIMAFTVHQDPSTLARKISKEIYEAVEESIDEDLSDVIDKRKLIDAIEAVVDAFEPLFGFKAIDNNDDDWDV